MQKNLQRGKFVQGHPTDRFGKLSVRKALNPRQEKMRDREGEQGRWPGYVNFTKVIFRSHQTEVFFPRGPPVLGMTSADEYHARLLTLRTSRETDFRFCAI